MPSYVKKSEFERVYANYKSGVIDGDFTVTAKYGRAAKTSAKAKYGQLAKAATSNSAKSSSKEATPARRAKARKAA